MTYTKFERSTSPTRPHIISAKVEDRDRQEYTLNEAQHFYESLGQSLEEARRWVDENPVEGEALTDPTPEDYFVGQRVLIRGKVIGQVVAPGVTTDANGSSTVKVLSYGSNVECDYAARNIKPLPGGQL